MKGQEIIDLWKRAEQTVLDAHAQPGGSLGDRIRGSYDVTYNGYSVCDFCEKRLTINYGSDCCDRPWTIYRSVFIEGMKDWTKIEDIDPNAEYDVRERFSPIERLERGIDSYERFVVRKESGRAIMEKRYFTDFKAADEAAQAWCRAEIDSCSKSPVWCHHTPSSVRNDEQRARERNELKHYEYYSYDGYHYWVSVKGD